MQPDPYHAVPEEKRNINGFRILPSGALVTDTPPFDRLFEEGTGNGLYALAVSNWETHRIGQKKMVVVYRLIAKGTIEEKIQELQESKRALSEQIIQGEAGQLGGMSKEDFMSLLS